MSNIPQAVQDAVYNKLNDVSITGIAPLVQHILEDTQPPLFVIGDISTEAFGGKDGGLDKVTFEVWTYSRKPNRTQLYTMQEAVRNRLDGQPVTVTGYLLSDPVEVISESEMLEDGETYVGTQRYETFAQPA